jgi:3-methyladenine DNA glycosylase AlkD
MARYGIRSKGVLGIPMPSITKMAKTIGRDHKLAQELWKTDIFDARLLAALIDDPEQVTEKQMDRWVEGFDSWAICDGVCMHLFNETRYAYNKAFEWTNRDEEFVKRAGFALTASLAVHDKKADDTAFLKFLPIVGRHSKDDRVYVKKAVNWALRQIGKRNLRLNKKAVETAKKIARIDSKSAKWIASDALRELESAAVQSRLKSKERS